MAARKKGEFPDYKEKQKLLYIKQTPPEVLLEIADGLLEEDRFSEAYDYIERSEDEKRIEDYMRKALDRGDFFNFERTALRLDLEIPPEMWESLADKAAQAEFYDYAVEAYRRAGLRHKAGEIIIANPEFFGPVILEDREKASLTGNVEKLEAPSEEQMPQSADADSTAPQKQPDQAPKKGKKKKKRKRRR